MTGPRLAELRGRTDVMLDQLGALISVETPSEDVHACNRGAAAIAALATNLLGAEPEVVDVAGRHHLRLGWAPDGSPGRVLLLGHFDTVWPSGTLAEIPFHVDRGTGTVTGPGCFDMKAGIVQLLHAVSLLDDRGGVDILLTSDEEIGSATSKALIEDAARSASATLVLEPSIDGALKVGRKGTGTFEITVTGRAAHAGLEPEKGANAITALAHLVLDLGPIARPELGTTVTPTVTRSGSATNSVPDEAYLAVDVRVESLEEAERLDREVRALVAAVDGTHLTMGGGLNRPPMPTASSDELFRRAARLHDGLGLGRIDGVAVGGGSDGNFTAAVGCPTLDGLGAVGAGAHAVDEHVRIDAMADRAALLAALIDDIRAAPPSR